MGTSISVDGHMHSSFLHRVVISTCSFHSRRRTYSVVRPTTQADLCSKPCHAGQPTPILCMSSYIVLHTQRSSTNILVSTTSQQVAHTTDGSSQTQSLKTIIIFTTSQFFNTLKKTQQKNIHQKRTTKTPAKTSTPTKRQK